MHEYITDAWEKHWARLMDGLDDLSARDCYLYNTQRICMMEYLDKLINLALDDYNDYYSVQLDYRNGKEVVVVTSQIRGSQIININGDSNRGVLIDVMRHLDINKLADGE